MPLKRTPKTGNEIGKAVHQAGRVFVHQMVNHDDQAEKGHDEALE